MYIYYRKHTLLFLRKQSILDPLSTEKLAVSHFISGYKYLYKGEHCE